jgi:hypothetical protein
MKNVTLLISAVLFSTLYYKQNIGLNLSLFTLLTVLLLVLKNRELFKNKSTNYKIIGYLITGTTVFLYKSDLTIIANIIAFFTLIGNVSAHKSSIYVQWLNGMYTAIVSAFSLYYDSLNTETKQLKKVKINYVYWLKIIGIPATIIIIFINLYRNGNPMFDELILKIDFSFINLHWMLFVLLGYYLFYNITHPIKIEPLTSSDICIKNYLEKDTLEAISLLQLKNEKQLGLVLMLSLNALIIFFLITDILHLSEIHNMLASQLSKQVHTGVNALIFSNILAIAIILYFFRGNLNFFENNTDLKKLTFVWIFLNVSVVIITLFRLV